MSKILRALKNIFKIHEHDKQLFCVGNIAFVKCMTCGDESIPWEVTNEAAEEWHKLNKEKLNKLYDFKRGT